MNQAPRLQNAFCFSHRPKPIPQRVEQFATNVNQFPNTSLYLDLRRDVQWRSLGSVGASIGDPFEGAGMKLLLTISHGHFDHRNLPI